jgi:hypothetical protein
MNLNKTRSVLWQTCKAVLIILYIVNIPNLAIANEMPLEGFPANGIVVRNERNIQIDREDLFISSRKIEVSYIFRNYSNKDIASVVAFPIPSYKYDPTGIIKYPVHGDFTVEVNGVRKKCSEITRAFINGKDCTDKLKNLNASIKDFKIGWEDKHHVFSGNFFMLTKATQKKLIDAGVVKIDEEMQEPYAMPAWSVVTTYYWTQTFPANTTTAIKHTYTPNPSDDMYYMNEGKAHSLSRKAYSMAELSKLHCLNKEIMQWVKKEKYAIRLNTIDYILTTANHWKQPIKEFHLIIEGDQASDTNERPSTCFGGNRLVQVKDNRYEVTIKNFIPKEEIKVYFISYPKE